MPAAEPQRFKRLRRKCQAETLTQAEEAPSGRQSSPVKDCRASREMMYIVGTNLFDPLLRACLESRLIVSCGSRPLF
jgi:hypothetical protein